MKLELEGIIVPVEEFIDEIPFKGPQRILLIDRKAGFIALFGLSLPLKAPKLYPLHAIEELASEGKINEGVLETPRYMLETNLAQKELKVFETRTAAISAFLNKDDLRWIFDAKLRARLVTGQVKKTGHQRKTILLWLYKYLQYGMKTMALHCAYSERGRLRREENEACDPGKDQAQVKPKKKRGPKSAAARTGHDETRTGIVIDQEIQKLFSIYTDLYTKRAKHRSFVFIWRKIIQAGFSTIEINDKGEKIYIPKPNSPTLRQYMYWYLKADRRLQDIKNRQGQRKWNLTSRPLGGRAGDDCAGPTDRFEIDSTIIDVYAVSAINRSWIIGRLILYFVVDVWSRMIVGFHLGLSGPSWDEAKVALFNAFTDKVSFCARHGIEITEDEWPCSHIPQSLAVDRGEMFAHKPEGIKRGLGIEIILLPAFRGDFKAVVERRFRILNDEVLKWVPGAVEARGRERGERDYRLDACLTIEEFTQVIIRLVLLHNSTEVSDELLRRDMLADNVIPTPLSLWNWGLKNATGAPRKKDWKTIYYHLLPSDIASVNMDGIRWRGMRYTCESEVKEQWKTQARNNGTWKVSIRWDCSAPGSPDTSLCYATALAGA